VGDRVLVKWRGVKPILILELRNRRGPGVDEGAGDGGVEELLPAPVIEPAVGSGFPNTDIWFRNRTRIDMLDIRTLLNVPTVRFGASRGWGPSRREFLISRTSSAVIGGLQGQIHIIGVGSAMLYVIGVSGSPQRLLTEKPRVTLKATIDATTSQLELGTFRMVSTRLGGERPEVATTVHLGRALREGYEVLFPAGVNPFALTSTLIVGEIVDAFLNSDNEVIATIGLTLLDVDISTNPTRRWTWPIVVNLTQDVILFNGVGVPIGAQPPNVQDGTNIDYNSLVPNFSDMVTQRFSMRPLVDARGTPIAAIVDVLYQSRNFFRTSYFAAYLCLFGAALSVVRTAIPLHVAALNNVNLINDALLMVGSNQRYVFWAHTTQPNASQPVQVGPVHVTDFSVSDMPDGVVSGSSAEFLVLQPVPITPGLLYMLNPPPANVATVDTRNAFAKFRNGAGVSISSSPSPLPQSREAAKLKQFAGASAFIPEFFARFLNGGAGVSANARYQAIPGGAFNPRK
jgi:hypothetical protein